MVHFSGGAVLDSKPTYSSFWNVTGFVGKMSSTIIWRAILFHAFKQSSSTLPLPNPQKKLIKVEKFILIRHKRNFSEANNVLRLLQETKITLDFDERPG